jgi:hypothetical protein
MRIVDFLKNASIWKPNYRIYAIALQVSIFLTSLATVGQTVYMVTGEAEKSEQIARK